MNFVFQSASMAIECRDSVLLVTYRPTCGSSRGGHTSTTTLPVSLGALALAPRHISSNGRPSFPFYATRHRP
jgi:hypothetical protein